MHISRLRLLGFKSFIEPTDLVIEPGLTGVVGPNGCGKSNLLEALRWVMGETSHKSMRAAAMDDVIFAGTSSRPARNMAEVTITIDNRARSAPAEYNGDDVIEITRRIEREAGSAYRINGREARARDVKILFEDAATGARSPALVRQGQIAEIVNAKPEQRRRVLEDAAGVAGLHSRRHEAELRLNAAEANLARLSDIVSQLGAQIDGLKRQARQVKRYRELSGEIRRAEAMFLYLQWAEAQAEVEAAEAALAQALSTLGTASALEAQHLRRETDLAEALPPLREEEAGRAAASARLRMERDNLEREAERARERERELRGRVAQLEADIAREQGLIGEARQLIERIGKDKKADEAGLASSAEAEEHARELLAEAEQELSAAEQTLADVTARAMEMKARKHGLESSLSEQRQQAARLERQLAALAAQVREVSGRAPEAAKLAETQALGQRLANELTSLEENTAHAEEQALIASREAKEKGEARRVADLAASGLSRELATLVKLLLPGRDAAYAPILDEVQATPGYEMALGAALGDDLDASTAPDASLHWRLVEPASEDPELPEGAEPLISKVEAPAVLRRRLQQIGVVTRELGARLQPALRPGQRLVSLEGDLWRWDGFVAAAEAPTAAAQRLAERNRLKQLRAEEAAARVAAGEAGKAAADAAMRQTRAEEEVRQLRQRSRATQASLAQAREALNTIEKAARETESRLAALADARERAAEALHETTARIAESEEALATLGEQEDQEAALAEANEQARRARTRVTELRSAVAGAERERHTRAERIKAAAAETERWRQRCTSAEAQLLTLKERHEETGMELAQLAALEPNIEEQRARLADALASAEQERQAAADRVALADTAWREAAKALKGAQAAVAAAREERARAEAKLEGARQRRTHEVARIRDQLSIAPEACLEIAEAKAGAKLPALADVDRMLTRLKADRERLGGVNLQAEDELATVQAEADRLTAERSDVETAIAKLRGGIGQLNREARKRLQQAFDEVNGHFQRLFTTLFGGGEARLEMVESEDPLEGGLEIVAKPPGKKPATLSLLSGGEQTLTALSLIFAVFLTNPSPICVLDEVDAPLDDANVERFCTLMERMVAETETRFLVITHHPMTMARMDRLFGVTMAEKGISQLVSVDLTTAESFVEAKAG
jgi:chromosome segregation protein